MIAMLINAYAGTGKSIHMADRIEQFLVRDKIPYKQFINNWPEAITHYDKVFLVGGDGTLNFFINKYIGARTPVVLFKGGTGNDFAWKLYGHDSLEQIYQRAMQNGVREIDIGVCNDRWFINGVGVGFDGAIVKAMRKRRKFSGGHLNYLLKVMRNISTFREQKLQIVVNDHRITLDSFMITIANGSRYGGGFLVAPSAELDDGLFDIVIIPKIHPLKRIFYLPRMEKGKHLSLPFIRSYRSNRITISCNQVIPSHIDGEFFESSEIEVKMAEFKLSFLV